MSFAYPQRNFRLRLSETATGGEAERQFQIAVAAIAARPWRHFWPLCLRSRDCPQGPHNRYPILKADPTGAANGRCYAPRGRSTARILPRKASAIPVSSTRRYFRDDFSSAPLRGHAAPAATPHTIREQAAFGCPVLARIPAVQIVRQRPHRRSVEGQTEGDLSPAAELPKAVSTVSAPLYRVDPPQSFAPHRGHHASANEPIDRPPYLDTSSSRPAVDDPELLPIPIRLAVRTWQLLQPHQPLLRAAAMFALVAGGGMSMALMVGSGPPTTGVSTSKTSVAVEQPAPNRGNSGIGHPLSPDAESAADFHPTRPFDNDPDASTTSVAPTAIGPAGPVDGSRYGLNTVPQVIPSAPPQPEPPTTAAPPAPAYPTTSYPVLSLPDNATGPLPQARVAEPPTAVAKLRGNIEEVQPR